MATALFEIQRNNSTKHHWSTTAWTCCCCVLYFDRNTVDCLCWAKDAKKKPIIQLRLHVLCFLLAININESYHLTGTGLLYIHTVISHFGPWYENCDFRNGSTESGEMFIAMCKNWALRYSSRRHDDALLEILVRLHFEAKVRRHCFHGDEVSRNKISREFEDHQWKELSLSDKLVDKYETDITAFLCMLQYYSYTMGVHFSFKKKKKGEGKYK